MIAIISIVGFSANSLAQQVNSVINLSATITPECRLTTASVHTNNSLNLTASTDLSNGSNVTFTNARADFNQSKQIILQYGTTPTALCKYEIETEKGGMTDGGTNGNNWRDYTVQLINGSESETLTTNSGQNAFSKIVHDETLTAQTDEIKVKITFPTLSGFTPNVGTYSDKLTLRVFTN